MSPGDRTEGTTAIHPYSTPKQPLTEEIERCVGKPGRFPARFVSPTMTDETATDDRDGLEKATDEIDEEPDPGAGPAAGLEGADPVDEAADDKEWPFPSERAREMLARTTILESPD